MLNVKAKLNLKREIDSEKMRLKSLRGLRGGRGGAFCPVKNGPNSENPKIMA
jgi:hypothetical protein